jgi:DNA-binding Lrp family transcriptional regulator
MKVKLDKIDLEILALLQKDSKQSISKIAEEVGKGISTVHDRMLALREANVIKNYSAVLSPE